MSIEPNTIYLEDCIEGMKRIPDGSIDMILCDLPYGTTSSPWDCQIDLRDLWTAYKRVAKENAAIVLFCSQPFTTTVAASNLSMLRYSLVWNKKKAGNFMQGNRQFMKIHEDLLVFYRKQPTYNPQKIQLEKASKRHLSPMAEPLEHRKEAGIDKFVVGPEYEPDKLLPTSILEFSRDNYQKNALHPTQKPVALCEFLIKTYTNEGETVLDNCMGSGTTALAAIRTGREYIGFENNEAYHAISLHRIEKLLAEKAS